MRTRTKVRSRNGRVRRRHLSHHLVCSLCFVFFLSGSPAYAYKTAFCPDVLSRLTENATVSLSPPIEMHALPRSANFEASCTVSIATEHDRERERERLDIAASKASRAWQIFLWTRSLGACYFLDCAPPCSVLRRTLSRLCCTPFRAWNQLGCADDRQARFRHIATRTRGER